MDSWKGSLGAMASHGETDGPRVAEANAALSWWKTRTFMVSEMGISPERAEVLLDKADAAEAVAHAYAEAVVR
jgi:hypothetical protein